MLYRCFLIALGATCLLTLNTAYSEVFPRGCEVTGFAYEEGHLIINETGKQLFYLIKNHSALPIKLQRVETRDVFMSPPLTAQLEPSNWAAFASDVADFHFECLNTGNDAVTTIDCREVLEICEYPRVKFALSNMGNYWVSVNKSQQQIIH